MIGNIGIQELFLIFAIILIVFGPRRLPEIARQGGKFVGWVQSLAEDMQSTIREEMMRVEQDQTEQPFSSEPSGQNENMNDEEPESENHDVIPEDEQPDRDAPTPKINKDDENTT